MKVLYSWLADYIGEKNIPDPEEIERLFTFHAFEVEGVERLEDDTIIDVDILPNRSSDCLSHRGVARELATLTGISLEHDPLTEDVVLAPATDGVRVDVDESHARRFAVAVVRGVKVGPSPKQLQRRLEALGHRSINNVVDATNYVMLALGQPLHAYDARAVAKENGTWHIGVRSATEGESVTTLTGDEYALTNDIPVIADFHSGTVLGIAGIKGGKQAEVTETTTDLIIEAANFVPASVRKASQQLKLRTDASQRFENEVVPQLVSYGLRHVVTLIQEIAGGELEGYVDVYPVPQPISRVSVTQEHIEGLLGTLVPQESIAQIFTRLGFLYTQEAQVWEVTPPAERTDIRIPEDVIEEIGRVYGYEHIQSVVPKPEPLGEVSARQYYSEIIRTVLVEQGFSEIITSSFRKKDVVRLRNALASDKSYLRSTLSKNILESLDKNVRYRDLLGVPDIRVFEIGTVFGKDPHTGMVTEALSLAFGVRTTQQGYVSNDDAICHGVLKKLAAALGVSLDLSPEKGVVECNLTRLLEQLPVPTAYDPYVPTETVVQYVPFSPYPFVTRDIALWVPEATTETEVERVLNAAAGELRVRTTLFDTFHKDGRTSYAFRIVFQSPLQTLTDETVNAIMDNVTTALEHEGWEVR